VLIAPAVITRTDLVRQRRLVVKMVGVGRGGGSGRFGLGVVGGVASSTR